MTTPFNRPPQVTDWHLAGEGVVYKRQSSPQQVRDHIGSAAHQEAQVGHLLALGWPASSIRVVEDQARSGTTTRRRPALQGLTEDVKSSRVRAVAMSEISRLGRNDMELQGFLLLCELQGVLLLDNGIPRDLREVGDWMLVNLLSVISEGENRRKNQRCQTARLEMARKGFPPSCLPGGLERAPDRSAVKVQDPQVREVLGRVFREALKGRTLREIGRRLVADGLRLPMPEGRGRPKWGKVTHGKLHSLLTNPMYAGQIVLYRHRTVRRPDGKRVVHAKVEEQEWVPGKIEAYVSLEEFHRIQALLHARTRAKTVLVGEGQALCPGLIHCGLCGATLYVQYAVAGCNETRHRGRHSYACRGGRTHGNLGKPCMSLGGQMINRVVEEIVLRALQPPSPASLRRAIREENERHQASSRLLAAELRQAEAKVADTQAFLEESRRSGTNPRTIQMYADELEAALGRLDEVRRRATTLPPPTLVDASAAFLAELTATFRALPQLWRSGRVGPKERKAIVRQVVNRIDILEKKDDIRLVQVTLHSGAVVEHPLYGLHARRQLIKRLAAEGLAPEAISAEFQRRGIPNNSGGVLSARVVRKVLNAQWRGQQQALRDLVRRYWQEGTPNAKIATELNAQGFRNTLGHPWTEQTVKLLARRMELPPRWLPYCETYQAKVVELLEAGLSNAQIAQELNRQGLKTYRRTPWTVDNIRRVRKRLDDHPQQPSAPSSVTSTTDETEAV